MILWLLALILIGSLGVIGFYQGALRVAFSLVGLILAAVLCVPLGGLIKPLLPAFSLNHPVVIAFVAPAIMYVLILVVFKVGALATHKKVETWYKYHGSDTQRSLFERMNARIGICLGVVNAFVYLVLISVVAYTLGYFTTQVAKPDNDGFALRMLNHLNNNLRDTGFVRAAAHFSPAGGFYYDACDLLGDIFANPLRQGKLSSYPPFLPLTERDEFKKLGEMEFQKFWQGRPSLGEAWNDEQLRPLITDGELYTNIVGMLEGDLKDLTGYFETGKSPKYEEDKILGRWKFDSALSYSYTKRSKPEMTLNEMRRIRTLLASLRDTTFVATVDKKAVLRIALPGRPVSVQGTWKNNGGGRFGLRMKDPDNRSVDVETRVDGDRLTFAWLGTTFVMERFEK